MNKLPIPDSTNKKESLLNKEDTKENANRIRKHLLIIADSVHSGSMDVHFLDTQCASEVLDNLCAAYQTAKDKGEDPIAALQNVLAIFAEDKGNILTNMFRSYAKDIGETGLNIQATEEVAEIVNWRGREKNMMVKIFKSGLQRWLTEFGKMLSNANLDKRIQLDELTSKNVTEGMMSAIRLHIQESVQTETPVTSERKAV